MNQILNNFIEEIKINEKLKNEFIKCETLEQSYDKFMKDKCSYEEYEDFFKNLVKTATPLSDEDLEQVAGGFSLKQILAPITIVTMLAGAGVISAHKSTGFLGSVFGQNIDSNKNAGTIRDGQIRYSIKDDSIVLKGTDSQNPATLDISKDLSGKLSNNKKLKIEKGIEHIKLDDQDVDISGASDLKSIDLGENNSKYKIVDSHLWTTDGSENLLDNLGAVNKSAVYDFCFDRLDELPKLPSNTPFENLNQVEDFKQFLALPGREQLKDSREYTIYHPNEKKTNKDDSLTTKTTINEKEVYDQIQNVVSELKEKVQRRTPPKDISEEDLKSGIEKNIYSKNYKMNKNWRIAKAIYRWVAKNISYDLDSLVESCRKPQDPLFVFQNKKGVCAGYSNLTNLMMRMAGIPSLKVSTLKNLNADQKVHGYTAIYLPNSKSENADENQDDAIFQSKESGWALLDSTWGSTGGSNKKEGGNENKKDKLKENFPGFYRQNTQLKNDNKEMLDLKSHKISHLNSSLSNIQDSALYDANASDFKKGNLEFSLGGSAEDPTICIKAKKDQPIKNFKISDIPQDILKYNYTIEITNGVESLTLGKNDNIQLKISDSCDLKSISVDQENKKYFSDGIAIWQKNAKTGEPENLIKIVKQSGTCLENENKVKYSIEKDKISLEGKNINTKKLPRSLRLLSQKLNKPFQIKK